MNQISLTGRLARNPELRYATSNKPIASFTIAVNRIGQENADFINCVVWNTQAENLCKYQEKGSLIGIIGSLRVDQYQDSNGDNRYRTYVLASNIEYLSKKKDSAENSAEECSKSAVNSTEESVSSIYADEIEDSDIPWMNEE